MPIYPFMNHLKRGNLWAVNVFTGYMFILVWRGWFKKRLLRGKSSVTALAVTSRFLINAHNYDIILLRI